MNQTLQNVNIAYYRSTRAKRMRITIHPTQAIRVTVPDTFSLKQAKEFVRSKQVWIEKHLDKMLQREKSVKLQPELSKDRLDEVKSRLISRLEQFSDHYNLPYNKAVFRCQKTRWGSCSGQNNISLNINIAYLPVHLQDYILLHELCHIRHKNHSKAFWSQLDKYCNDKAKELSKELRQYRMKIRI